MKKHRMTRYRTILYCLLHGHDWTRVIGYTLRCRRCRASGHELGNRIIRDGYWPPTRGWETPDDLKRKRRVGETGRLRRATLRLFS